VLLTVFMSNSWNFLPTRHDSISMGYFFLKYWRKCKNASFSRQKYRARLWREHGLEGPWNSKLSPRNPGAAGVLGSKQYPEDNTTVLVLNDHLPYETN
jgi:hypothetical protein